MDLFVDSHLRPGFPCGCPATAASFQATDCEERTSWSKPNTSDRQTQKQIAQFPLPHSPHLPRSARSGSSSHHTLQKEYRRSCVRGTGEKEKGERSRIRITKTRKNVRAGGAKKKHSEMWRRKSRGARALGEERKEK